MDIMKIMGEPETKREKYLRLKAVLDKNREACSEADLAEGGKYHKAYEKLCGDVMNSVRDLYKDEVLLGFPFTEATKPVAIDIWKSVKDIVNFLVFDGKDAPQLFLLMEKLQKVYEKKVNEVLGTDLHYIRKEGIEMPILVSDAE